MCSNFHGFDCEKQGFDDSTDTGVVREYVLGRSG